jgi:cellobiose dehydrogenase (acceptor)
MPNSLLLVAWPEADAVKTKFVYAGLVKTGPLK